MLITKRGTETILWCQIQEVSKCKDGVFLRWDGSRCSENGMGSETLYLDDRGRQEFLAELSAKGVEEGKRDR